MLREKWRIITAALLVTGAVFCPLTYADDSGDDFEIVSTQKSAGQQNNDPGFDISTDDSSDENVSFEIVAKKQTKELDLSQRIITDDPEFEIVRTRAPKKLQNGTTAEKKEHVDPAISEYEKKKKIYDDYVKEKKTPRDFLFFSYIPFDNTINGIDARLFITGVLVSLFYVVFMLVVLTREIGRRPRLYSAEQMIALRNQGYGQIPEDQANQMANDLWNRVSGGKAVDDYNEQTGDYLLDAGSHGEVNAVYSELEVTASALPTSEEAIAQLNRLSDSVCFWRTRALVAP